MSSSAYITKSTFVTEPENEHPLHPNKYFRKVNKSCVYEKRQDSPLQHPQAEEMKKQKQELSLSLQGCTRSTASSAAGLAGQGLQHGHHGAASPPHPADPVMLQILLSDFSLAQAAKTGIPNTLIFSNNMFSPLIAGDDIFISIVQSRRFFIMESIFFFSYYAHHQAYLLCKDE